MDCLQLQMAEEMNFNETYKDLRKKIGFRTDENNVS